MIYYIALGAILFVWGTVLGSFINMLVYRTARDLPIWQRSFADSDNKKRLFASDLVPVFSYIYYRGKSHTTGEGIPWYYPAIEILTGGLILVLGLLAYNNIEQLNNYVIVLMYLSVVVCAWLYFGYYDVLHWHVDVKQLGWYYLFTIMLLLISSFTVGNIYIPSIFSAVSGGILMSVTIAIVYWLSKGGGMGSGDIFLFGLAGMQVGIEFVLILFAICFNAGALIGLMIYAKKGFTWKVKVPLAPFIGFATITIMLFRIELSELAIHLTEGIQIIFTNLL